MTSTTIPRASAPAGDMPDLHGYYRLAFEKAPVGMLMQDADTRILRSNKALQDMLGYSAQELATTGMDALVHREDSSLCTALNRDLFSGRRDSYQLENRLLHKDGHALWCKVDTVLVRDLQGRPQMSLSVLEDIDDRKQFEAAVRRTVERYELIFNAARWGIFGINNELKIVFANASGLAMLDWVAEDLYGKPVEAILGGAGGPACDSSNAIRGAIDGAIGDGLIRHADGCTLVRRNGNGLKAECTIAPIVEDGRISGTTLVIRGVAGGDAAPCGKRPATGQACSFLPLGAGTRSAISGN